MRPAAPDPADDGPSVDRRSFKDLLSRLASTRDVGTGEQAPNQPSAPRNADAEDEVLRIKDLPPRENVRGG